MILEVLQFVGNMLTQILEIPLPWGFTFGQMLVGVLFFGILISVLKAIFTSITTGTGKSRGSSSDGGE